MTKQIKVSDETYERLQFLSKEAYRTLGGEIDYLIDDFGGDLPGKNNSIAAQPFVKAEILDTPKNYGGVSRDPDDYLADVGDEETDPAEFDEAPRKRIVADVLAEMTQYKADVAERLENCQDADTTKQINKECSDTLNSMWAEVAALKKGEN